MLRGGSGGVEEGAVRSLVAAGASGIGLGAAVEPHRYRLSDAASGSCRDDTWTPTPTPEPLASRYRSVPTRRSNDRGPMTDWRGSQVTRRSHSYDRQPA